MYIGLMGKYVIFVFDRAKENSFESLMVGMISFHENDALCS